ncbi:MAG: DUF4855 domain-containing protein [Promethearchaeota archaeon]
MYGQERKRLLYLSVLIYAVVGTVVAGIYKSNVQKPLGFLQVGPDVGNIHDMVLIYSDLHGGNLERDFQVDDFLPLLMHYTTPSTRQQYSSGPAGMPDAWFGFDGFLFMALGRNRTGRYFYPGFGSGPSNKSDWEWLIQKWFRLGYDFDALEQAILNATSTLGVGNYPYPDDILSDGAPMMKIVISCPVAVDEQQYWGVLGYPWCESNHSLNFYIKADRIATKRWFIDRFLTEWSANKHRYPHLKLVGFYWLEESIWDEFIDECKTWNAYIHELGYKSFWIPYHFAHSWNRWSELGFDGASVQPNLFFDWRKLTNGKETVIDADPNRVEKTANMARQCGMGVEYEIDDTIMFNDTSRDFLETHFYKYQDVGATSGFINGFMTYYQCVQTIRHLLESENEIDHQRYHQLWQFVNGKYVPSSD